MAERAKDIVVIMGRRPFTCAGCQEEFDRGSWFRMDDEGTLCLDCADLGHLEFLGSGNAALTRRAKKHSRLSAVVVQWARARNRYERQGILVEPGAIEQAEQECLADVEVRERRRQRDLVRREAEDEDLVERFAAAIRQQFPGCPELRAARIARHTVTRSSGRVGRSAAGRSLDPEAVRLAVVASVRHVDTPYENLLMGGFSRQEARDEVRDLVDEVLTGWQA
ncbi:hypothetical protein MLP_06570 [Microlunatus phosphovorus NM-1]|uniref:DUF2293 domain-containing protein n=1 Tax=Microlunatus phosphovorus (strain ATCC 700054 / DSM 10555 / JCM 9379 / NBRC 101784 / NCIMB 13414 / VKM Ac-1990 / NM-1) TaxID=1032480 RepID=F5XKY3_MICPN|nr:DUF2293 domain-containing protein [Microlunatus phosphovorus]BAK33671.1 hypothetical protein MLP_06570 [Microlunatus phosphovorus NM-1]